MKPGWGARIVLALGGIVVFAPQPLLVILGCSCVAAVWYMSYLAAKKNGNTGREATV